MKKIILLFITLFIGLFCSAKVVGITDSNAMRADHAVLDVMPLSVDFGVLLVGGFSTELITISNPSADTTTIFQVIINGNSSFSLSESREGGSRITTPMTVYPHEVIELYVRYAPEVEDTHTAMLTIKELYNSGSPLSNHRVSLYGEARLGSFELDPPIVEFPDTELYSSPSATVFITNNNPCTATINEIVISGNEAFTIDPIMLPPFEIEPLQSAQVSVSFYPTAAGEYNGVLHIYGDGDYTGEVLLSGSCAGEGIPVIRIDPDSQIEHTMMEQNTATLPVTIYNDGNAELEFTIDDSSFRSWLTVEPTMGIIGIGGSCTIDLHFNTNDVPPGPVDGGVWTPDMYISMLTINSNDPEQPIVEIQVNLEVTAMPIFVDFSANITSGQCPLNVSFTDLSRLNNDMGSAYISSWRWDFQNDGIVDSFDQHPIFNFNAPGLYSVKLTITTNTGTIRSVVKTNYIEATNNPPVVVYQLDFIQDMYEDTVWGPMGLYSIFNDPDGDFLSFSGVNSPNIFVQISGDTFSLSSTQYWHGTESIQLAATDPSGEFVTQSISVTVIPVNNSPIIEIPDTLYFIRNSHYNVNFGEFINDPDNADSEISITIIPASPQSEIFVDYQPGIPGALDVEFSAILGWYGSRMFQLMANDNQGRAIASEYFWVQVLQNFTVNIGTDVSPAATSTVYQYTGQAVKFRDKTLGNADWWQWNFGDGNFSSLKNPSHSYMNPGTYTVTLTLRNIEAGTTSTASQTVNNMFTFSGVAVDNASSIVNWTAPSYNLFGDVTFAESAQIGGANPVELVIFSQTPVSVSNNVSLNNVTLRPPQGTASWGGLAISGSVQTMLQNTTILDAIQPITVTGGTPTIENVYCAPSDTTQVIDQIGIIVTGDASPQLSQIEVLNYTRGIVFENTTRNRTTTPTITNTRVRNSTQGSRTGSEKTTGITVRGDVSVEIEDVDVEKYDVGIKVESLDSYATATVTMTNTRVRNSTQGSRPENDSTIGLYFSGNVVPILNDVEITGMDQGIVFNGGTTQRTTPILTNTRVRNSTQGSRNEEKVGILLADVPSVILDDCEVEDYDIGIQIKSQTTRTVSTPTLSNTRVRNSTQGSRSTRTGVDVRGNVVLQMDKCQIDDYFYGIQYIGTASTQFATTPTITNTRVRNSNQGSRATTKGVVLTNIPHIIAENDSIIGYYTAIEITNPEYATTTTPTISNVRVRNSNQGTRGNDIGILLGEGVGGSLKDCEIEESSIGILLADGCSTTLTRNKLKNCEIGIRGVGLQQGIPIEQHVFVLTAAYEQSYPNYYRAMDLLYDGPWEISNNTITGYPVAISAENADISFFNNILWSLDVTGSPFSLISSTLQQSYNNIRYYDGVYMGTGNINQTPLFNDDASEDFTLHYNSPCIDAGSPIDSLDEDGSISDIGAFTYLHKAEFEPSSRLISVGDFVSFANLSFGHGYPESTIEWDLNNDDTVEATSEEWEFQFTAPGSYDLRLIMTSGNLVDEYVLENAVVVMAGIPKAPAGTRLSLAEEELILEWNVITQDVNGYATSVDYYIIYVSAAPEGTFAYLDYVQAPDTYYADPLELERNNRFYVVLGFIGTEQELQDYLLENTEIELPYVPEQLRREVRALNKR